MRIEPSSTSTFRGQVDEKKLAREIKKEQPKKRKKNKGAANDKEDGEKLGECGIPEAK